MEDIDQKTTHAAKYSIILVIAENGLGSLLHSLRIPLAGHLLSINQIGLLTRALYVSRQKDTPLIISLNASLIKSIGPSGKKLTPMLAILSQGLLFTFPLSLIGINLISIITGIFLSSLWAFIQPILFIYIFFGDNSLLIANKLLKGIERFIPHFKDNLWTLVFLVIIMKFIWACGYSFFICKMSDQSFQEKIQFFHEKMHIRTKQNSESPSKSLFLQSLKELFNKFFIIYLLLTAFIFYFSEANMATLIWALLRPIGIGVVIFYFIKLVPLEKSVVFFNKIGWYKVEKSLLKTIQFFRN